MRHRKSGLKLNMSSSHRQAMFRNMVTSLLKHDRIKTTDTRAKELRRWADHIITLAKRGDLHARRQALAIVREKDVVHKLFEVAGQRFGKVNGGYTRITKLGRRAGDAARISMIELITVEEKPAKKKKTTKSKAQTSAPAAETAPQPEKKSPKEEVIKKEAVDSQEAPQSRTADKSASETETADADTSKETASVAADEPPQEEGPGDAAAHNSNDADDQKHAE
jgi:large subunit ribosomal protein L17